MMDEEQSVDESLKVKWSESTIREDEVEEKCYGIRFVLLKQIKIHLIESE